MWNSLRRALWMLCGLGLASRGAGTAVTPAYSWAYIESLVRGGGAKSVEAVLSKLPANELSYFTLMSSGGGLQEASGSSPRAIVFGREGKLILGFNGSPEQAGYETLEVIRFDEHVRRFEFREIKFGADGAVPRVSPSNPPKCLGCHMDNPRPIWAPYRTWPGAVGEDDDYVDENDKRVFAELRAHPRYRYLGFRDGEAYPFRERSESMGVAALRPNLALTEHVARWNSERMIGILMRSPYFEKYKTPLYRSLTCGVSAELGALIQNIRADAPQLAQRFSLRPPFMMGTGQDPSMTSLPDVLLALLGGDDARDWDPAFVASRGGAPAQGRFYVVGMPYMRTISEYFVQRLGMSLGAGGARKCL